METKTHIAILGWGSLLWEEREEFDAQHGAWLEAGPALKIEYSRISKTRDGALTLVIDPLNGVSILVHYCLSKRSTLAETVKDLQTREGTIPKHVGYLDLMVPEENFGDEEMTRSIRLWADEHNLAGVVWTNLPSNFQEQVGEPFSVESAVTYLEHLRGDARTKALDYIAKTLPFVQTPLRVALKL